MTIETYHVGSGETEAYRALKATIPQEDRYMHYRLEGNVAEASDDYYFVAHEDGVALSRLWMSVPKNDHPIANWGAFFTLEEYRGRGIGGRVLDHCPWVCSAPPARWGLRGSMPVMASPPPSTTPIAVPSIAPWGIARPPSGSFAMPTIPPQSPFEPKRPPSATVMRWIAF